MLNSTGHKDSSSSSSSSGTANNLVASDVPLPDGSPPPPTPRYEDIMQQQQPQQPQPALVQQQQHQQHQAQQPPPQPHHQTLQQQPTMFSQQQTPMQFYRTQTFGALKQPLSFSSLAKRAEDVVGETLSQYGPGMVGTAIPTISQHNVSTYPNMMPSMPMNQSMPQMMPQAQYNNHYTQNSLLPRATSHILTNQPPVYNISPRMPAAQPAPMPSRPASTHIPGFAVPSASSASFQQPNPLLTRSNANVTVNHMAGPSTSNNIVCGISTTPQPPPASISPPLDELNSQQDASVDKDSQKDESSEASDLSSVNILEDVKKRCGTMVMNQMLEEYRHLKLSLGDTQRRREALEKEIFDLRRLPNQGHLETHPAFVRKKEIERQCDVKCKYLNESIKFVANRLLTKYQHTVQDNEVQQPLQAFKKNPPTRAKMSTAATPPPRVAKPKPEDEKVLFDFEDGNLWCKPCDLHFDTLKEYCDHLHKRDHQNQVGPYAASPPWRENPGRPARLDKPKTYWKMKSICSNVGNMYREQFRVQDIDEVMHPFSRDHEKVKMLNLNRERGRIAKDDRLFNLKGFDHLVPVTGFYCKICHETMCDVNEVEEHLRYYAHNHEYGKYVCLQYKVERKFRTDMEKSRKALEGESEERDSSHRDRDREPRVQGIRESFMPRPSSAQPTVTPASRAARAASEVSQYSARLPYKKPTSRIVDDHEVIADKFDKREEQKREEQKREEPRRGEDRRDDRRRDDRGRDEPKRDYSTKRDESRRDESRRDESRRDESRRDESRREGSRRDESRRDESRREEPKRGESSRRDERKRDDVAETDKRSRSPKPPTKSSSSSSPSKSRESSLKRKLPEIVPVTKSSSGALKKLRNDNKANEESETGSKEREETRVSPEGREKRKADEEPFEEPAHIEVDLQTSTDEDDGEGVATQAYNVDLAAALASDDNEVEIVKTLFIGDEDSPFPELDLTVTGSTHQDALKSKQLRQRPRVVLNRINPEDFKDLLLPTTELWTRVTHLITKKEPDTYQNELDASMKLTERAFLKTTGDNIPVDVDESSTEDKGDFDMNRLQDFFCDT